MSTSITGSDLAVVCGAEPEPGPRTEVEDDGPGG